ncbi:MAG: hypothetical protein GY862_03570 [Gammaproteobacteria bacterium]|nr:hypothetical protein [Gammaproteobacteria bacterium]
MQTDKYLESVLKSSKEELIKTLTGPCQEMLESLYEDILLEFYADLKVSSFGMHGKRSPAITNNMASERWLKHSMPRAGLNEEYIYRSIESDALVRNHGLLSIFMPAKSGASQILDSVSGIRKEIDVLLDEGVDCELNICINNSRYDIFNDVINGVAEFSEIKVNVFELADSKIKKTGKLNALYFLYNILSRKFLENNINMSESYIHIADTDVSYPYPAGGLLDNINELKKYPELKAISGTYTTSDAGSGFQFVNSIRKNADILRKISPLPYVYGGALTLRYLDFGEIIAKAGYSLDAFITLFYLNQKIHDGSCLAELVGDAGNLPVRTNPRFLVDHPESASYIYFVRRFLRDIEWRKDSVHVIGDADIEDIFMTIRRAYFSSITEQIDKIDDEALSKICHLWLRKIRDKIYHLNSSRALAMKDVDLILSLGCVSEEFELCRELINDKVAIHESIEILKAHQYLDNTDLLKLDKPGLTDKDKFKVVEKVITHNYEVLNRRNFLNSEVIRLVGDIVCRVKRIREAFANEEFLRVVFLKAGIKFPKNIIFEKVRKSGKINLAYYVSAGDARYFLRFHDPIGLCFFPKYNPAMTTYIYTTCERIFRELLGDRRVANTLYPSLDKAVKNYCRGNDGPFDNLMSCLLVQEDFRREYFELSGYCDFNFKIHDAAKIYASVIGEVHGKSYGISRYYMESMWGECKVMRLLNDAKRVIRFPSCESYEKWLMEFNWVTRIFRALGNNNSFYNDVNKTLASYGIDINRVYDLACRNSVKRFCENGSIGHFDLTMDNMCIKKDDINDFKIYDFDHVAFVDPAYEMGWGIYSLMKHSVVDKKIGEVKELVSIIDIYKKEYYKTFLAKVSGGNFVGERFDLDQNDIGKDSSVFAGIAILSVFSAKHEQATLDEDYVESLKYLCCELLTVDSITTACSSAGGLM